MSSSKSPEGSHGLKVVHRLGKLSPEGVDAACKINPKLQGICAKYQKKLCLYLLKNYYKYPGNPVANEDPCTFIKKVQKYSDSKGNVDYDSFFSQEYNIAIPGRQRVVRPVSLSLPLSPKKQKTKTKSKSVSFKNPIASLAKRKYLPSPPITPPKKVLKTSLSAGIGNYNPNESISSGVPMISSSPYKSPQKKRPRSKVSTPSAWKNPFVFKPKKSLSLSPRDKMNWSPTLPRPPLSVPKPAAKRGDQRKFERMATCIKKNENITEFSRKELKDFPIADIATRSPKLAKLFANIEKLNQQDMKKHGHQYKHYIFVNNKTEYGIRLVIAAFMAKPGYNLLNTERKTIASSKKGQNNFGFLASSLFNGINYDTQKFRKEIMGVYNDRTKNVYGEQMNIILLDSGFKEGIDLFDVKYVHIFDELKNDSETKQAVGRALRFCGQKGLPFVKGKGWSIEVFNYKLKFPEPVNGAATSGSLYWEVIDNEAKYNKRMESYIENILEYVSII